MLCFIIYAATGNSRFASVSPTVCLFPFRFFVYKPTPNHTADFAYETLRVKVFKFCVQFPSFKEY